MQRIDGLVESIHPATFSGALIYAGVVVVLGVVGSFMIRSAAKRALRRDAIDQTAIVFFRPLAQIVLWVVLLVMYAHLIPALRAVGTAMLAGASVASIVLGVAAQNTLGNLIAGLALLIYRPFRIHDRLQVMAPTGVETGLVENITLGYTVLQTYDNRRIVMPNSQISGQTTVNLTSVDARVMTAIPIAISYTADIERARAILLDIAKTHPNVGEVVHCPVVALGDSSVTLSVRVWCHDPVAARHFEYDLYEQAKKRFGQAGVEIPYPYYNVIVDEKS